MGRHSDPGPSVSYYAQSADTGILNDPASWGYALFTDGSAAGASANNLTAVTVNWPGSGGYFEMHHLVERSEPNSEINSPSS